MKIILLLISVHCVAQTSLKLTRRLSMTLNLLILTPPPPKLWNYRHAPLHPVYNMLRMKPQTLCAR